MKWLLLDANVIIYSLAQDVWDRLLASKISILAPSSVINREVKYYKSETEITSCSIDLERFVSEGGLGKKEATAGEMYETMSRLRGISPQGLGIGETEAITIIDCERDDQLRFCTGDALAIQALAALNLGEYGISFEEALSTVGLHVPRIRTEFTREFFTVNERIGKEIFVRHFEG